MIIWEIYYLFILLALGVVVLSPLYALLSLIVIFIGSSFCLLIAGFEFLGLLYIVVYVGAIAVLFLFVIMFFNLKLEKINNWINWFFGTFFLITFFNKFILHRVVENQLLKIEEYQWSNLAHSPINFGWYLYTNFYDYIFLSSGILLIGMVGAIILTSNKNEA